MAWFSPYVLADGQVDTRGFDRILAHRRFAGKRGGALALALWQWLVDGREGFYHFLAPVEEPGETLTADPVKDPIRLLNSYGYGLCGNVAMLFVGLYDWAGERARVVGVPGHTISEAWWDGAWHFIDCDLRAVHYKKTGDGLEVASLHDIVTNPDLVANPIRRSEPYYMSDQHAKDIAKGCYAPGQERYLPHYLYRLGTMDYCLRPGESLTLYYQPQGHFYWGAGWDQWIRTNDLRSFTGPSDKKDPSRRYAGACIRWRPDLHADLDDVGVSATGFERAGRGLVARDAANAVRYRLISPYVICGRYEGHDPRRRRVDAVLLRVNASAAPTVRVHTPRNGRTTEVALAQDRSEFTADLTEWLDLHYEYELSISLPIGQTLRGLAVDTRCQVSAAALPAFAEPGRAVRLVAGNTQPGLPGDVPVLPHMVDLVQRLREGQGGAGESAHLRKGRLHDSATEKLLPEDGRVEAVAAVEPPLPGRIARVHVMAGVASQTGEVPEPWNVPPASSPETCGGDRQHAVLEMAEGPDGPWQALDCRPVPVDPQGYHFSLEGRHTLSRPAERVWLRLRSPRPVGVWRVRIDYRPQAPSSEHAALDVLFRWRQDGALRTFSRRLGVDQAGAALVPVEGGRVHQPLHVVLAMPSRGQRGMA